ncbi:hypothetical protein P7C73_g2598, partial [Tremellales sp. Uapishka_1]
MVRGLSIRLKEATSSTSILPSLREKAKLELQNELFRKSPNRKTYDRNQRAPGLIVSKSAGLNIGVFGRESKRFDKSMKRRQDAVLRRRHFQTTGKEEKKVSWTQRLMGGVKSGKVKVAEDKAKAIEAEEDGKSGSEVEGQGEISGDTGGQTVVEKGTERVERTVAEPETRPQLDDKEVEGFDRWHVKEILRTIPPMTIERGDFEPPLDTRLGETVASGRMSAGDVPIEEIKSSRTAKVANLESELWRVLFNPGVHHLRDPRTGTWNFPTTLGRIPTPEEFAFDRCPKYITPGDDPELIQMAEENKSRFVGSTSTLTKSLSQVYFALSGGKGVELSSFSQEYASEPSDFTFGARLPACLIVKHKPNGTYTIDNDKQYDTDDNVLSDYGRILEKFVTSTQQDFERFTKAQPDSAVSEEERNEREAYAYSKSNSMLMRSQLDCIDSRLPGSGTFDIKTRACSPIRYDRANYKVCLSGDFGLGVDMIQANSVHDISAEKGLRNSFEREYFDLARAGMLKYSLQARIGHMDGIFVAYHNTARCFGFQYIPLSEMDERLCGSTEMAQQAYHLGVGLLEVLFKHVTEAFPDRSLSVVIKARTTLIGNNVTAYIQPYEKTAAKQDISAITMTLENYVDDERVIGPFRLSDDPAKRKTEKWTVKYTVSKTSNDAQGVEYASRGLAQQLKEQFAMTSLAVPEGTTPAGMTRIDDERRRKGELAGSARTRWREADRKVIKLREQTKETGAVYKLKKEAWKKGTMFSGLRPM